MAEHERHIVCGIGTGGVSIHLAHHSLAQRLELALVAQRLAAQRTQQPPIAEQLTGRVGLVRWGSW